MPNLIIGNLSLSTTEKALEELLSRAGQVRSAQLALDPQSGKRKGFAFVQMSNSVEAQEAVKLLNGADLDGRSIMVSHSESVRKPVGLGFLAQCRRLLSG